MCWYVSFVLYTFFFFFKQKTAYELRISDWSSDVCASDLITVEEGAQIVHPVFQHRQPVDAGAKGKALPFRRIKPTGPDDIGVNHAGAQHFHPSFRPANDALPLLHRITDIDLHRRFSEGEITKTGRAAGGERGGK